MITALLDMMAEEARLSLKDREKLSQALDRERENIAQAAVRSMLVPETVVLSALSGIFRMAVVEFILPDELRNDWAETCSRQFLKQFCMVPFIRDGKPSIAVNDPSDPGPADDLAHVLGGNFHRRVLAPRQAILSAVNALYEENGESFLELDEDLKDQGINLSMDPGETADLLDDASDAPVIRLVNHMISQAVKAGASDIHIEPFKSRLVIRYRIDGILYEMLCPPRNLQAAMVSRIKVMASMNIAEKRVPQDGRAQVRIGDQEIDLRISTVPTGFGERLVMRLLNKSGYFLALNEFGMSRANLNKLNSIIRQANGIVLVTGPTGSGKTTTLYAGLSEINAPDKSIITIEDPVEYNIEGIGQIQVNPKTGVTFATGLRSIVRQDPDVILVGEIRDIETASIAIQSALTGHLVFSTLHTNDAASAVTRLVDLGVEPYLISSSVNTIIAQRLVRVLCPACKEAFQLSEEDVSTLGGSHEEWIGQTVFRPRGCAECFNTGYSGRQAIFEILDMDEGLKSLVLSTSDASRIRDASMERGMIPLRQDGMEKVFQGITSIREVLRVTQQ